ncbi:hypothetical protein LXL04_033668 [Taraxacum kok-saghyz]
MFEILSGMLVYRENDEQQLLMTSVRRYYKKEPHKTYKHSPSTPPTHSMIETSLRKLCSVSPEDQRDAAAEIRLLSKRNDDNRVAIAKAGVIPLISQLLTSPDSRTQEHAVTAILNLLIFEDNKSSIVSAGAIPGIIHVLKEGNIEAQ